MSRAELVPQLSPLAEQLAEDAAEQGTPNPAVYGVLDHCPELMRTFHEHWRVIFDGGVVDRDLKELVRLKVANFHDCDSCLSVRVSHGEDFAEKLLESFTWRESELLEPRERAAMRLTDWLMGMDDDIDNVYAELRQHFTEAEIVELGWFASFNAGTIRFVRSWALGGSAA